MAKHEITVKDFNLFCEVMKSTAKIVDSAKFILSDVGLEIYGAHGRIARCEITTNAISSKEPFSFAVESLSTFNKIISTVKEVHDGDYSGLKFTYDGSSIRFSSKKFKTKLTTQVEETISKWISKKVETVMEPLFEFTTTPDFIKRLNNHSFMFTNAKDVRVYLETNSEMENNAVFATLGNKNVEIGNEMTLKFGLVNAGAVPEGKSIIIDFERLNLFNTVPVNDIKIAYTNYNCLVSKTSVSGKDGAFFNLNMYCTLLKS